MRVEPVTAVCASTTRLLQFLVSPGFVRLGNQHRSRGEAASGVAVGICPALMLPGVHSVALENVGSTAIPSAPVGMRADAAVGLPSGTSP